MAILKKKKKSKMQWNLPEAYRLAVRCIDGSGKLGSCGASLKLGTRVPRVH